MRISSKERSKIIDPLVATLEVVKEPSFAYKKQTGADLQKEGVTHDQQGKLIVPNNTYTIKKTVMVPVDHARRLGRIIDRASDKDAMTTALAEYMVKYGMRPVQQKQ